MSPSFTQYSSLLTTYLRPLWRSAALMAVLLLTAIAIDLLSPQIMRGFIDTAERGGPQAALTQAALTFLLVALVGQVVRVGATYMSEQVGWGATNRLRGDLLRHVLRLDLTFHKLNPPGALIERVDGDVTALANFFSRFVVTLVGNGLLMVGTLTLLWLEDWRVGIGVTLYVITTLAVLNRVQHFGSGHWQAALQTEADLGGFLEERLRGTEDIRANGAEGHILAQLDTLLRDQLPILLRAFIARSLIYVATNALFAIGYAVGLALGAWLYTRGEASIGTAFLITAYVGLLSQPLENIRGQVEDFQQASAGIARVKQLLLAQPSVRETARVDLPDGALMVEFFDVSFGYGDEEDQESGVGGQEDKEVRKQGDKEPASSNISHPTSILSDEQGTRDNGQTTVLHDISFRLAPGRVLGLLGRTGSGKTTLTRLLFRLYDPNEGDVRLGGINLRELALSDVRRQVGMVTQDVQIFAASVRDNITLFDQQIEDDAIWQVLETLGLHDLFRSMPAGLDTQLGAGGAGLSAGQAQLLACARVFLRDPGLVILDEASSRLDPATEALLERAIDRLLHGRTAIIIAHRLATIRRADEILILDEGRVAESGPRAELAANRESRFAMLLRMGMEEVLV